MGVVDEAMKMANKAIEEIGGPPIICTAGELRAMFKERVKKLDALEAKGDIPGLYHECMVEAILARIQIDRWLELFDEIFQNVELEKVEPGSDERVN